MRLLPRSLTGRLVVTALLATTVALALAALSIGHVLGRFVMHGVDERLDAQIAMVARAVQPDGSLEPTQAPDISPFDQPGAGWAWQVIAPRGTLRSGSLGSADLPLPSDWPGPPARHWRDGHGHNAAEPRPLDGFDAAGRPVHGRMIIVPTSAGDVRVVAVAPREIVDQPLREAVTPLLVSLLVLAAFLVVAILVQLRIGLRPLQQLRTMVAEVRAGRVRRLTIVEPTELLPLIDELNALIASNEQAIARARGHVANLAHGLKTPLSTLRLGLASHHDIDARLVELVDRMDSQIRHHLGRARAAEAAGASSPSISLAEPVTDLVNALTRIHAERQVLGEVEIDPVLRVQCDPQDFDELVGNVLDNAWRHARSAVRVRAFAEGRSVVLSIKDDGAGMTEAELAEALIRGRRLDEAEPGHGLGLAISRELAELHGGTLELASGTQEGLGGLAARISLPAG